MNFLPINRKNDLMTFFIYTTEGSDEYVLIARVGKILKWFFFPGRLLIVASRLFAHARRY